MQGDTFSAIYWPANEANRRLQAAEALIISLIDLILQAPTLEPTELIARMEEARAEMEASHV